MNRKQLLLIAFAAIVTMFALLAVQSVSAYSGFPTREYPGNQYGYEYRYYNGPWGERMIYGSHGYFPNFYGYQPYGFRTYGQFYTPWDMRWGTTMRTTARPFDY